MTGTPHTHRTHVPGCHRCDLSREEAERQHTEAEREAIFTLTASMLDLLKRNVVAVSPPYGTRTSWALIHMGSGAILALLEEDAAMVLTDVQDGALLADV